MLSEDDEKYMEYLEHKYGKKVKVSNQRLLSELRSRKAHFGNRDELLDQFENNACLRIWNSISGKLPNFGRTGNAMDYNCTAKVHHPNMTTKASFEEIWSHILSASRCEAKLLKKLLSENKAYSIEDYRGYISKLSTVDDCLKLDIY